MGVDDLRVEGPRLAARGTPQPEVPHLAAAAPVEHGASHVVAERHELALEIANEDAEVRVGRPGIHLGDEQDPHAA